MLVQKYKHQVLSLHLSEPEIFIVDSSQTFITFKKMKLQQSFNQNLKLDNFTFHFKDKKVYEHPRIKIFDINCNKIDNKLLSSSRQIDSLSKNSHEVIEINEYSHKAMYKSDEQVAIVPSNRNQLYTASINGNSQPRVNIFQNENSEIASLAMSNPNEAFLHLKIPVDQVLLSHEIVVYDLEYNQMSRRYESNKEQFFPNILFLDSFIFANGVYDHENVSMLKLFDKRMQKSVASVVSSQSGWLQQLANSMGISHLQPNLQIIQKAEKDFNIVCLMSYKSNKFSFPMIFDLRKMRNGIRIDHHTEFNHLKEIKIKDHVMWTIQRDFQIYRCKSVIFKQWELTI